MKSAEHGFVSQTAKEKEAAAKQDEECGARIREPNRTKSKRLIRDEWPDRGE